MAEIQTTYPGLVKSAALSPSISAMLSRGGKYVKRLLTWAAVGAGGAFGLDVARKRAQQPPYGSQFQIR